MLGYMSLDIFYSSMLAVFLSENCSLLGTADNVRGQIYSSISFFFNLAKWKLLFIYMEDITWWREDMNFMFEWQEQYLLPLFEDFRRFSKTCFNVTRPLPTIFPKFPKITENYRRLLRKARRCFDHKPTNLSTI